jgi:hypothetical protein
MGEDTADAFDGNTGLVIMRTGESPLLHDLREIKAHVAITRTEIGPSNLGWEIHIEIINLRELDAEREVQVRTCVEMRDQCVR